MIFILLLYVLLSGSFKISYDKRIIYQTWFSVVDCVMILRVSTHVTSIVVHVAK